MDSMIERDEMTDEELAKATKVISRLVRVSMDGMFGLTQAQWDAMFANMPDLTAALKEGE